ncbi:MAG: hypothetical protein CVT92_09260 [Bacteroidetes bacterium HGW-Bacteroidetes-1]|jgi:hypothetical protein|nr:MAG: hypothetical protein CVT92_09260 [Bacteroidetes bacterium HGW-Bacteroidetes-1]
MKAKIQMGNDEFILYIRKTSNCNKSNDLLGREIWKWLRDKGAKKLFAEKPQPCFWETTGPSIDEKKLPQDATQFEFERAFLPELYDYLDELKT